MQELVDFAKWMYDEHCIFMWFLQLAVVVRVLWKATPVTLNFGKN